MTYNKSNNKIILIIVLVVILVCSVYVNFNIYAHTKSINNHIVGDSNIYSFSYDNGFIVVSSSETRTAACYIDKDSNEVKDLTSLDYKVNTVLFLDNKLIFISNVNNVAQFKNFYDKGAVIRSYDISREGLMFEIYNDELKILDRSSAALDRNGNIYFVNENASNEVLVYDSDFEYVKSINVGIEIDNIISNKSKSAIYMGHGEQTFCLSIDNEDIVPVKDIDLSNCNFLDDNIIITNSGLIYYADNGSNTDFSYIFSSISSCKDCIGCLTSNGILTNINDGLLYNLDINSGEPLNQILFDGDLLLLDSNDDSILLVTSNGGTFYYSIFKESSFSDVEYKFVEPVYNNIYKDDINKIWKDSLPLNKDKDKIFEVEPDMDTYLNAGKVSYAMLDDGINAINFYRNMYGFSSIHYNEFKNEMAQKSTILKCVQGENVNNCPPNMPSDFYKDAISSLDYTYTLMYSETSPTLLCDSIHKLFSDNCLFRNLILSEDIYSIGMGIACDEYGNIYTSIYIDIKPKFDSNVTLLHPGIAPYPCDLLSNSTMFDVLLQNDICFGERGEVKVNILDNSTSNNYVIDLDNDLNIIDNQIITFLLPNEIVIDENLNLNIEITGLYNKNGIASIIKYSINTFKLDYSYDPQEPIDPEVNYKFSSDVYSIDWDKGIITGLEPSTSLTKFKSNITYEGYELVYINYSGMEVTSGYVGTAWKVNLLKDGNLYKEFNIILFGDLNGNGKINNTDITLLCDHLLYQSYLLDYFLVAADVDHDGKVSTVDLLLMKEYIDGTEEIIQ